MAKEAWEAIAASQYNLWKNNPVTLAVFGYYQDWADSLAKEMLLRWRQGVLTLDTEKEALGRVNTLNEIINQDFNEITSFYGIETKEKEEADAA